MNAEIARHRRRCSSVRYPAQSEPSSSLIPASAGIATEGSESGIPAGLDASDPEGVTGSTRGEHVMGTGATDVEDASAGSGETLRVEGLTGVCG